MIMEWIFGTDFLKKHALHLLIRIQQGASNEFWVPLICETHHEKTDFLNMQKQTQISFAVSAKLISMFVFAT